MSDRKEPSEWEVIHYADTGATEEFVQQLMLEMPTLVDAGTITPSNRQQVKEAILTISMEGLLPAFEHLKRIRRSLIQSGPELNRKQFYEDFARVLWHAYQNLLPNAALLMSANIGFLFQNETKFDQGLKAFAEKHDSTPSWFGFYLKEQRAHWQNGLADFRNHFLEHRRSEAPDDFFRYSPDQAEFLFEAAWKTTANILAVLLSMHLPRGVSLVEIPINERHPFIRQRFEFVVVGIPSEDDSLKAKAEEKHPEQKIFLSTL